MNWLQKIQTAWKNKEDILEGFKNRTLKKEHIEEIAAERLKICKSNVCGVYDPTGSSKKAVLKGTESCGDCGCNLSLKTRCLHCKCPLGYWKAIIDEETSQKINDIVE